MTSEMGEDFKEHREEMQDRKQRWGIDCPGCIVKEPKRIPTRLMPGWTCKVCGYHRPSKHTPAQLDPNKRIETP